MKQNLLNKLWLRVGMIVAVMTTALAGSAWAESVTTTFASGSNYTAGMTLPCATGGLDWVTSGKPNGFENSDNNRGMQWTGINSDLTTTITDATITEVKVVASTNQSGCSISAYAGNTQIGSSLSMSKNSTNITYTFSLTTGASGQIKVSLNNPAGKKSIWVKSITVTYTPAGSSAVATTTTIDASGITNTNLYDGTAAGTLSASVTETVSGNAVSGATVTWSSSNTGVATIDASTGAVTLVGAGNVKFTAAYAGVEDQYIGSSAEYNMTVTNTAPAAPATLPFVWDGGTSTALLAVQGVTGNSLGDYAEANAPYLVKLDNTGDYIQVWTNERPGIVTIDVKMLGGANPSSIIVQESADGENFTNLQTLTISGTQNSELALETSREFAETSRYVRLYFNKDNNGSNIGVGPISIDTYAPIVLDDYTLTIANPENVTITATYGEGEDAPVLQNGENGEVEEGTEVMIALTIASGYVLESLTIAGVGEGQTITPVPVPNAEGVYTFNMPAFNVTISATVTEYVAPVTATYTLATSITSGKRYVIASGKEDGTIQVMGDQANNNRPAVAATITDGVLSVSEGYEFVIESATVGSASGFSILDENDPSGAGYLYAASSSSNYLRTQAENNANGIWAITIGDGGVASIVAQGTNTRKVMQYNSTNTLFSCYGEASQAAVYLFEKVEATPDPVTIRISSVGYGTLYYGDRNLVVPQGVTASTYKVTNKLEVSKTYGKDDVIPAGTAVVLQAAAGDYTFNPTTDAGTPDEANLLKGSDVAKETTGGTYYYALTLNKAKDPNSVGFYWMVEGGGAFQNGAHKAYLALPNTFAWYAEHPNGVKGYIALPDDDATGIENLNANVNLNENIYNLAGQRLQKMQKGINIVNGKKILK
ncbi:MAG: hypothetical protein IKU02_08955 [Bacteroidaceae bacterium]|nr:hypothetical protein [Bacteroidaceae bacterium]